MFESINEIAVLVTTILAAAVGSIWYSPLLFGKTWMNAVGITEHDMEASKEKMPKLFAYAFLGNLVLLYIVAQFHVLASRLEVSVWHMSFLLVVLVGAVTIATVIWERKPLSYFFINLSYIAAVILGGMAVIGYWPW